jgi:uroporphyrinogen decarboxylase
MSKSLKNDNFLRALWQKPIDHRPIWIMRQAGRYLPEYRATRAKAGDFLTLMQTPELACEVTLQPLARFPLDAAILFSDILTIPDALGLGLDFAEGEGPFFHHPLSPEADFSRLSNQSFEKLGYVYQAVATIKAALQQKVPLIGFSGSPWTLACYMLNQHKDRDFHTARQMAYRAPEKLRQLLEIIRENVLGYLREQIRAGADAVMLFDTWGGLLSAAHYEAFSLQDARWLAAHLPPDIPKILFSKGGGNWLKSMADSGFQALGLDWQVDLAEARRQIGDKVALQGNLDPLALKAPPETLIAATQKILAVYGQDSGHIFNLGHGITPDIDPEQVALLVETVHRGQI